MTWKKLEYGKWPTGRIALRIVSDNGFFVQYKSGEIKKNTYNHETYFIQCKDGLHKVISIDSIFDTEPHYIELDNLEMPS
jgi:hypothetical protein